jgi:hypothetical protein
MPLSLPPDQRGVTTLAITLALLAAMLVTLLAANRNLLLELRQSSNQAESAVAFEAAEAGLDWAVAMLNDGTRVGTDCRPSPMATVDFRARHLDTALASFAPRPLRPACVRSAAGWACACPDDAPAVPDGDGAAFALRFEPGPQAGQVRAVATGCHRASGECRPDGSGREVASARHEVLLALQPALVTPPMAALTVRPAGLSAEAFFVGFFGLSKAQWKRQPAVHEVACRGDCGDALEVLADQGTTLMWLPGDAVLRGPLSLGTPDRPVLIVADGTIRLQGAVQLHGAIYALGLSWSAPAATVRGAMISEGSAAGDASLDLARDTAVLQALRTRDGSFTKLPGSWRDF